MSSRDRKVTEPPIPCQGKSTAETAGSGACTFQIVKSDAAIIGGGLVGGSLAVALADAGVAVSLVDARADTVGAVSPPASGEFDRRVFAIRPAGRQFLERCDVWQHIDESRVAPVTRMVVTGDDGVSRLTFDAYRSGIAELAVIVESSALQAALRHALDARLLVSKLMRNWWWAPTAQTPACGSWQGSRSVSQRTATAQWSLISRRPSIIAAQLGSGFGQMACWRCCRYQANGYQWCGRRSKNTPMNWLPANQENSQCESAKRQMQRLES